MKQAFIALAAHMASMPRRRAFTLIELVVVLVLLGVLTHMLVNETTRFRSSRLRAEADRGLEAIRSAVAGDPDARDATGARIREGFIADMGRAPRAVPIDPDDPDSPLSLRELWEKPAGAGEFALRQAVAGNLVAGCADLADPDVYVPCGWRGPYLRLPQGQARLRDPWGNTVETPDSAGQPRIFGASTNESASLSSGDPVAWVRHLGADGREDSLARRGKPGADDADSWCRIDSDSAEAHATRLLVTARVLDRDGCADASATGRTVSGTLFSPCGGAITAAVSRATVPAGSSATLVFEGLTPGTRVLRLRLGAAAPGGPESVGVVHSLRLQPGDNSFVETFRTDSAVVSP